jgi:hypothetical protein
MQGLAVQVTHGDGEVVVVQAAEVVAEFAVVG